MKIKASITIKCLAALLGLTLLPMAVRAVDGNAMQTVNQLAGIGIAVALASVGTFIVLKLVDLVIGLRVTEDEEISGLDASQHG